MTDEQVLEQETEVVTPTDDQKAAEEQARVEAEEAERRDQEETESKPWFKKRFDEITRQKYEERERAKAAEKRAQDLEARLQALEKERAKPEKQEFTPTRPKPKLSEFEEKHETLEAATEAWGDAIAAWNIEQYDAKQRAERQITERQRTYNQQIQTYEQKRISTVNAGREKYPDFMQVVETIPQEIMDVHLASAIVEMTDGASVAYYLGKNIREAERISQLSPYAMAAELGKIEARLSKPEKQPSNAPPPVSTIKGKSATSTIPDPAKDPEGYIDARNRGLI